MTDQDVRYVVIFRNEVDETPTQLKAKNGVIALKYLERCFTDRAMTLAYYDVNGIKTFLEVDDKDNIILPDDAQDFYVVYAPEGKEVVFVIIT